jgi:hypothetical protein
VQRLSRIAIAVALAAIAPPMVEAAIGQSEARAAEPDDALAVGTELLATSDFSVHKAEIAKGSRVSVTKLIVRDGRLDSVNVALPDGHVVKMPIVAVRSYFRVVTE